MADINYQARIKSVEDIVTYTDEDGVTQTTDLSLTGEFVVVVEYVDKMNPEAVLITQTFQLSASETVDQISKRITDYGAKVRDSKARVATLRSYVGALIPIPETTQGIKG